VLTTYGGLNAPTIIFTDTKREANDLLLEG